jgi:hypothetical protein
MMFDSDNIKEVVPHANSSNGIEDDLPSNRP